MPILNYTTKIAPERTVAEIQRILAKAGATSVSVDYDEAAAPIAVMSQPVLQVQANNLLHRSIHS